MIDVLQKALCDFIRDDAGAAMVEYGLLVALIAVVAVVAVTGLGTEVSTAFNTVSADLAGAL